jgi:hypothetical protein
MRKRLSRCVIAATQRRRDQQRMHFRTSAANTRCIWRDPPGPCDAHYYPRASTGTLLGQLPQIGVRSFVCGQSGKGAHNV